VIISVKDDDTRRQLIRDLKPHTDIETRDRIRHVTETPSPSDIRKLRRSVEFLNRTPPDPDHTAVRHRRTEPERQDTKPASKASKKAALYALNRHQRRKSKAYPGYNWRDHFWIAAVLPDPHIDDNRRACIVALMLTGCRPSELCDDLGVTVTALERPGQAHLAFNIAGAKLAEKTGDIQGTGQESREIEVRCQTPESEWMFAYVRGQDGDQCFLVMSAPTHSQNGIPLMPTERRRRVSERLGKLIGRLGKVAFPRFQQRLTPYVFRHALSSDLRAIGGTWSREDVAIALGHQSARTQMHYGSGNSARRLMGSRAGQITRVSGTSPVRNPDRRPHPANPNPKPPTP
jgi:integrase